MNPAQSYTFLSDHIDEVVIVGDTSSVTNETESAIGEAVAD